MVEISFARQGVFYAFGPFSHYLGNPATWTIDVTKCAAVFDPTSWSDFCRSPISGSYRSGARVDVDDAHDLHAVEHVYLWRCRLRCPWFSFSNVRIPDDNIIDCHLALFAGNVDDDA